jgi:hypothetical protein
MIRLTLGTNLGNTTTAVGRGEDWNPPVGDAAGLEVYAVAAGQVVLVGSEYLVPVVQN